MAIDLDHRAGAHAIAADRIFDGYRFHSGAALVIEQGRVLGISAQAEIPGTMQLERLPEGALLAPGFIDVQVNGGGGVLLNDHPTPEGLRVVAETHSRLGTTACLPTFITDAASGYSAIIEAFRSANAPGVLGLHLEGPFLNPGRPGIHRVDYIRQPAAEDQDWLSELKRIAHSLVTLAPECVPPGFIKQLSSAGITVAAGHSKATAEQMQAAVTEGLAGVTHLFNAMPPMTAREPGIIGATLANSELKAGIIVDGFHVHPTAIAAAYQAKGSEGLFLVSDAMPSVGSTLKEFDLQGRRICLQDGRLASEDGTLAGAHLDMASAVRNVVRYGLSVEDALRSAALTPAKFLGIAPDYGTLLPGARSDCVALDRDFQLSAVWLAGQKVRTGT